MTEFIYHVMKTEFIFWLPVRMSLIYLSGYCEFVTGVEDLYFGCSEVTMVVCI